ncbi:conjugative transfer signal peptidase TraF (plasmid) [Bradyrhizobium barranii]|uniref:Conjugative transfer signal peptidase TraF n=1 Tax=Bradyrhizobium barranii TaxID=2992140 RepID=A0ABY3R1U9_9BRAD|nr:conjugative transfer signal peptidase TraF [Bradyrhizobium japonicum]UFW92250.1 conjugative transfer signal peptidase TraF [Bradyrhizobium japonicum]
MRVRRSALVIVLAGAGLVAAVAGTGWCAGLRINMTPSYPRGLWQIEPLNRAAAAGDLVFICPPDTAEFQRAFARGYIRRGLCAGGLSPLIKTVAALTGHQVDVADRVFIDGHPLSHSNLRRTDSAGRVLAPFAGGVIPAGELYLHSDFAGSYDSRYFGPIPSSGLLGLARPVFVFGP